MWKDAFNALCLRYHIWMEIWWSVQVSVWKSVRIAYFQQHSHLVSNLLEFHFMVICLLFMNTQLLPHTKLYNTTPTQRIECPIGIGWHFFNRTFFNRIFFVIELIHNSTAFQWQSIGIAMWLLPHNRTGIHCKFMTFHHKGFNHIKMFSVFHPFLDFFFIYLLGICWSMFFVEIIQTEFGVDL